MAIVRLTPDYSLGSFDCGDSDLNDFLLNDAKDFQKARIASTYLLVEDGKVKAYFCLLNDKISRQQVTNTEWKRIKAMFSDNKQFGSYPSVKIGRFAVDKSMQGKGIGRKLMYALKVSLLQDKGLSSFRFLMVDAYLDAVSFYEKNNFKVLMPKEENGHTKTMFFDMLSMQR